LTNAAFSVWDCKDTQVIIAAKFHGKYFF